MEKLFYRYLSENSVELSQKLAKMGYKFITPEFLEDMEITFNYDHKQGLNEKLKDFLNLDASSVVLDDKFENTKFYKYR